jgi:hypothetical protein
MKEELMGTMQLVNRIESLNENQLGFVFRRLMLELNSDEEPILAEEDIKHRQEQDSKLLEQVAANLHMTPESPAPERSAAIQLLSIIIEKYPDYRSPIVDALDELNQSSVHLDFGLTFALSVLIISIAAAVVRPRVTVEENIEKNEHEEKTVRKTDIQVQGVDDIASVIKAVLPFIPK